MDRRDFLKTSAALPSAAVLPLQAFASEPPLTAAMIKEAINRMADSWALASQPYYVIVHPAVERMIRRYRALEVWGREYRLWRKDRGDESLENVMRRVKAELETAEKIPHPIGHRVHG